MSHFIRIPLPAGPQDDLTWVDERVMANEALEKSEKIIWQIDLGFQAKKRNVHDRALFQAHAAAFNEVYTLWKQFEAHSHAISLYQGSSDFSRLLLWTDQLASHFEEWLAEKQMTPASAPGHYFQVFCANVFSEYLHRIASLLPVEAPLICRFETPLNSSPARNAHILSKERFEHIQIELENQLSKDSQIGVLMPPDDQLSMDFLSKVDQVLSALAEKGVSYRLISESFLTEEWDGIDDLLVLHHCGSLGKRKLQGFCAAGGRVVRFNEPIGVAEEQPFEEWIISNEIQKSDLGFGAAEIPIFELRSL